MSDIIELWKRLDDWLTVNAPTIAAGLNDGASVEQLAKLQTKLSIALPQSACEFYSIHDGQDSESPWLFDATEFLSIDRIIDEWEIWQDLFEGGEFEDNETTHPPEICDLWWSPKWMPITYNGAGDHNCLDFDPGSSGTVGQVIEMWHDDDERTLQAISLEAWFAEFVTAVEQGRYELSDDYGGLSQKD